VLRHWEKSRTCLNPVVKAWHFILTMLLPLDLSNKHMFKGRRATRAAPSSTQIKPQGCHHFLEVLIVLRHRFLHHQIPVQVLDGSTPRYLLDKSSFFMLVLLGDWFFVSLVGVVVVKECTETGVCRPPQYTVFQPAEQIFRCLITLMINLLPFTTLYCVVLARSEAV